MSTLAEKYTVQYIRCDNCGCSFVKNQCPQCEDGGYPIHCYYIKVPQDVEVTDIKDSHGDVITTFSDGSTFKTSMLGW